MTTVYIVVKTLPDGLVYFAGTPDAPRWAPEYADAVQFSTRLAAHLVAHASAGVVHVHEVDA